MATELCRKYYRAQLPLPLGDPDDYKTGKFHAKIVVQISKAASRILSNREQSVYLQRPPHLSGH